MQVGIDSYVTVAEADAYITSHYRSTNAARIRWDAISDDDKTALLLEACMELESLPFIGRKAVWGQALSFPRLPMQYGSADEPPPAILNAQIELALWLSDDAKVTELSKRAELQKQGVESFSVGDLSESYAVGAGSKPVALSCPKAAALLAAYLNGGHATC